MPTIALSVLDWLDANPGATSRQKHEALAQVPPAQWAVPGGHWSGLSKHCCNRVEPAPQRRPANTLNIEIGTPLARCLFRSPDGRGASRNGGSLDWLRSGGDVLAYGRCEQSACFRAHGELDHV